MAAEREPGDDHDDPGGEDSPTWFTFSRAENDRSPFTLRATVTEEELECFFGDPVLALQKKGVGGLPLISPSLFSSRTRKTLADVEAVTALGFDVDIAPKAGHVADLLEKHLEAEGIVHETFSSTREKPRYRFMLRTTRFMSPAEHRRIIENLIGVCAKIGIEVDRACTDATRGFYAPARAPGGHYSWRKLRGSPVNVDALLLGLDRHPVVRLAPVIRPRFGTDGGRGHGDPVLRAAACVRVMPPALQGADGSGALMDVALCLARGFALQWSEARAIFLEYNQRCEPPWSEREILHKWRDALEKGKAPFGHKLERAR